MLVDECALEVSVASDTPSGRESLLPAGGRDGGVGTSTTTEDDDDEVIFERIDGDCWLELEFWRFGLRTSPNDSWSGGSNPATLELRLFPSLV